MAIDRSMSLVQVAREIHKNAVDHGWWDGERDIDEIYALIHSEWSEALEEARAGRDDVWFACNEGLVCDKAGRKECGWYEPAIVCDYRGKKPEGICVELIDGVIRIMDYIGHLGSDLKAGVTIDEVVNKGYGEEEKRKAVTNRKSAAEAVNTLHTLTASASEAEGEEELMVLIGIVAIAWQWIKGRGLDPMQLLIEKHEYNVTRPYKHGKKF